MKKLNALLFALATIVLISSCKKDDDPKISKTELLAGKSAKSWKMIASKKNGSDNFSNSPACNNDDILVLRTDKTYEWNEGASKCDQDDDFIFESGNWSLKSDEKVINMGSGDARINELTESKLRVTYILNGDNYDQTYAAQ